MKEYGRKSWVPVKDKQVENWLLSSHSGLFLRG